jgi:Zn-dependent peptidase ImmA (M78 family)
MAWREDILLATYEADRLHREFATRSAAEQGDGRVDVFGMLVRREVPVMFRPLTKLLGAYLKDPAKGVLITTQRPLPVQRFTAAHELGHEVLGHEASLDEEEILTRALFATRGVYDAREVQANAFASQLLTPQWLIAHHMRRQGWDRASMVDPARVYQLSLRMGASYTATIYALEANNVIEVGAREYLLGIKPKTIKQSLTEGYRPQNWYGDVWVVTERDGGMVLEGSRSDVVVIRLEEHASSGYLWQFGELADAGLMIRQDGRIMEGGADEIGGVALRLVIAEPRDTEGASGHVTLEERRPWLQAGVPNRSVELDIELNGPVPVGLLPQQREALLGAA